MLYPINKSKKIRVLVQQRGANLCKQKTMGQQDKSENHHGRLQGRSVVDICTEYGISQSQYYKWRDIFLAHIEQPFETGAKSKKEQKLEQENMRLRKVIGDLTVELKKNDW